MTNKGCPACRLREPHRASKIHCSSCNIVFAAYHVPPEENGVRLCSKCRAKLADDSLF